MRARKPKTRELLDIRLWWKQQFKTRGQHTHNGRRWSKGGGHWKGLADDGSIAAKALLEILVAQNCHRGQRGGVAAGALPAPAVVGGCGVPSESWKSRPAMIAPPIIWKKLVDTAAMRTCSGVPSTPGRVARNVLTRSEILEIVFCAIAQVEKVDIRKRKVFDVSFLQVAAGEDQSVWIFVRKLSQQHAVSDTKDGRAGADSQGDGDDRCDCKYGTLAQRAKRVGEVV